MLILPSKSSRASHSRPGMIAVIVLITLIVISLIGSVLFKQCLTRRSENSAEECRLQVDALVNSGLDLGLVQLGRSSDYRGETWSIPSSDLGGRGEGRVVVRVENDPKSERFLEVQAEFPRGSTLVTRRTKRISIKTATATGVKS